LYFSWISGVIGIACQKTRQKKRTTIGWLLIDQFSGGNILLNERQIDIRRGTAAF
jgi:hypothetical protein